MHYRLLIYFIISLFVSAAIQFIFFKLSQQRGLFIDNHESGQPQKFHRSPTPRIGGVGIFISCLLFAFFSKTGALLLISAIPAFLAGLYEDIYLNFSPKKRLLIMIASGILPIVLLNTPITNFGLFNVPYWVGCIICFIAILGLINGANMIDGFNGILGGISLIIFSAFAFMSFLLKDHELLFINSVIIASLLGFLLLNYPMGNIFMGDGGAYLIGFFMAVISMLLTIRHSILNPFFLLLCISYPVMEVIFSFTRKGLIHHASPFQPDRNHLHMLINRHIVKGYNSGTILVLAPIILIYNLLAIYNYQNQTILILLISSFILLYLFSYYFLLKHQQKAENRKGRFFNEILRKVKLKT